MTASSISTQFLTNLSINDILKLKIMVKVWLKSHDMHFFSMESERNHIRKGCCVNLPYETWRTKVMLRSTSKDLSARDVLNNGRSWTTIKSRTYFYTSREWNFIVSFVIRSFAATWQSTYLKFNIRLCVKS